MDEKGSYLKNEDGCNLDCPVPIVDGKSHCCKNCSNARAYFINDTNRHLWSKDRGFGSKGGCKLPRDKRPPECLSYDCRKDVFLVIKIWAGGWQEIDCKSFSMSKMGELKQCLAELLPK